MEINRQYIGARYVPKFYEGTNGTEWDENVAYEPLTIVTYLSNSYTSKKAVPASVGDPIHNSEYWASTGNYNAQVEAYRREVLQLDGKIDDVDTRLDNKIDAVDARVDTVVNRDYKNYVLIGDSYSDNPRTTTHWTDFIASIVPNTRYAGISGYGFCTGTGTSFIDLLNGVAENMTTDECADVTDVCVCGGWNDGRAIKNGVATSTVVAAIRTFYDTARTLFPNANVWIGAISYQTVDITQPDINASQLKVALDLYESTFYKGLRHLENVRNVLKIGGLLDSSYFHPNDTGGLALGAAIYNAMNGGYNGCASKSTQFNTMVTAGEGVTFLFTDALKAKTSVNQNVSRLEFDTLVPIRFTPTATFTTLMTFNADVLPVPCDVGVVLDMMFVGAIDSVSVELPIYAVINNSKQLQIFVGSANQNKVWEGNFKMSFSSINDI